MLSPPQLIWRTQPNFLYTLLLVNGDIEDALEVRTFNIELTKQPFVLHTNLLHVTFSFRIKMRIIALVLTACLWEAVSPDLRPLARGKHSADGPGEGRCRPCLHSQVKSFRNKIK